MQPPYFLRCGFPPSENERLQTIRDVLCFMPPREPPHLYKFFQFSKCHLTQSANDKLCKNTQQTMGSFHQHQIDRA